MINAVGLLAGMLTTLCWMPQLRRVWRTRSTHDISWLYLGVFSAGVGMWLAYGVVEGDLALMVSNAATAAALIALICLKARFDRTHG